MHATPLRLRLAPTFEWIVAAAFLAATLAVALLLVQEMRSAPAAAPVLAPEPRAAAPSAIPERAISVSALVLNDGVQVRVGDTAEQVARLLGPSAEVAPSTTEAGPLGPRVTKAYERQGTRFMLVFEPFERSGGPRVAGIYLQ